MKRREFLSLTGGGIAALTGCIGDRRPGAGTTSPTDGRTVTPTTTTASRKIEVTVESAHLQYGFVTPGSPDSITLMNGPTQYLVASVHADGSLARDEFALRIGTETYEPTVDQRLYRVVWGDDQWYSQDDRHGLLLFTLLPDPSGTPRLTWPTGDEPLADRLRIPVGGSPPPFSASLDLPETYDGSEAPPVRVDVRNEGERRGRFLGALNRVGPRIAYTPVDRVSRVVPAGTTDTITVNDSWSGMPNEEDVGDDEPDVRYFLDYAGGEDSAEIQLS